MSKYEPKWIVNDLGELGVSVMGRCFFLYKGENIEYRTGRHEDGTPILHRPVGKREFGETCVPAAWAQSGVCEPMYTEELVFIPGLSAGSPEDVAWRPLPEIERKDRSITRRLILSAMSETIGRRADQIVVASGVSKSVFTRHLKWLRDEKRVYIIAWQRRTDELTGERKSGTPWALYAIGNEKDAPRPKWLPKNQVQKKWHARNKARMRAKDLAAAGKSNMFDQLRYAT